MSWAAFGQIAGEVGKLALDQYQTNRAFSKSKAMAREQMRFQERMANTQYQRAAKDLEAAGLNRVLALGSPAHSPSGATATMTPPQNQKLSVIETASAKAAIDNMKKQNKLLDTQEKKVFSEWQNEMAKNRGYLADSRLKSLEASKQEVVKVLYDKLGKQATSLVDSILEAAGLGPNSAKSAK